MFRPFGLPSENRTAEWHPEPTTRGTFSLVSTCLITMGLCIWTAVHLNIPGPGERVTQFWRKVFCVLIGLFAPELIAWTAYEQYKTAQLINQRMLGILRQKPRLSLWRRFLRWVYTVGRLKWSHKEDASGSLEVPAEHPDIGRHPWTFTHSQYAAMGGYAMAPSHSARRNVPDMPARSVLRDEGFLAFAGQHFDLFPDISENEIRDKSKASALAKTLVCIQAGWFCVQCIARLSQGLAISLLELNTFAHAICALLVYLLWWYKPLDIEEPTVMQGEFLDALQMAFWVPEIGDHERLIPLKHGLDRLIGLYEARQIDVSQSQIGWLQKWFRKPLSRKKNVWATFHRPLVEFDATSGSVPQINSLNPNEVIHGWKFNGIFVSKEAPWPLKWETTRRQAFPTTIKLDASDEEKLRLLAVASHHSFIFKNLTSLSRRPHIRNQNTPARSGFISGFAMQPLPLRSVLGLTTAGLLYGSFHLVAWNAVFPTPQQLMLWRMSGLVLALSGFVLALINSPIKIYETWRDWKQGSKYANPLTTFPEYITFPIIIFYWIILGSCWILYIFARVYLVVECFLTLKHLPPSALKVPIWSQYIPHIV